ncbi:MAG TPA: hypothetical protein VKE41_14285 [Roseiflexaceae bacterium]|nr:hypothetical protein [Roseiflexaceae bacterium]
MFTLADIANGPAILTIGLVGGGVLFLLVVLIEAVVLRLLRWAVFWRSLRDALVANLASALIGLVIGCVALSGTFFDGLTFPVLVAAWLGSIVIEAGALKLLSSHTWRAIWLAALVANTASYVLIGPLFWQALGVR